MCFTALPFPHVERQLAGPWCISLRPVTAPPELGNANVPEKTTATWDQPPTEIKKSSWIISFPVQPGLVEISEDQPSENKHRLFIQRLLQRGSQPVTVTCVFAETRRQAEEWESFPWWKEGKASGVS